MGLLLLVLLIVAPLVELYVIIQVAQVIGGWETLALLIVVSAVGAWLLKQQGLSVIRRVAAAVDEGRVPDKELVDGLLILVAGALMLAPGFVGDVIAYLLLLPPTRALFRAPLVKRFARGGGGVGRFASAFAGSSGGGRFVGTFHVRAGGDVIDVSGRDDAPPRRLRP